MIYRNYFLISSIFVCLIIDTSTVDINLSPRACWNQNGVAITGSTSRINGSSSSRMLSPFGLSIIQNVLYVSDAYDCRVVVVYLNSTVTSSVIVPQFYSNSLYCLVFKCGSSNLNASFHAFVTNTSFYVVSFCYGVGKLSLHNSGLKLISNMKYYKSPGIVFLFVDNNDDMYLSLSNQDEVRFHSLKSTTGERVAGSGSPGSSNRSLDQPLGIYVNNKGAIYIADSKNHRIMKWEKNASSGVQVAGSGIRGNDITQLNTPTYVIVDVNEYMYVSEAGNHRITRWISNSKFGVCIAACTGSNGADPTRLNKPHSLAFDSNGSLYISDSGNHRVQKFAIFPYPVEIQLSPSALSPSTPVIFGEHQIIEINSTITSNQTLSITTQWTIFKCSSTCSNPMRLDSSIATSKEDLVIAAHILQFGVYKIELTVTMIHNSFSVAPVFTYIEIVRSSILVNLIESNATTIIQNFEKDLVLNPGEFSTYSNQTAIKKSDWLYLYYCRMKLFDDVDQECFENSSVSWEYGNLSNSSVTIFARSLKANETYEFMVELIDRYNSSFKSVGYLTVDVRRIEILINCIIIPMCTSKDSFHYVNPTTQLNLFSLCLNHWMPIVAIQWNIYQGFRSSPSNLSVQWLLFPTMSSSLFYGLETKNLTILKDFFIENHPIIYWRLEVIYSFTSDTSVQIFDIELNEIPKNGRCSIHPRNGTIITLFTINCSNWFDKDRIKDYIIYDRKNDTASDMMLAHSTRSIIQLYLPASVDSQSSIDLIIHIRDTFDVVFEFHIPSVTVLADSLRISNFIDALTKTNDRLLTGGDPNIVGQLVTSLSQVFNEMHEQFIQFAVQNGMSSVDMLLISLNNQTINTTDPSMIKRFKEELNIHAYVREYLLILIRNFSMNNSTDMIFYSSILAKLTEISNQLTLNASRIAWNECQELSDVLNSLSGTISIEQVNLTAINLLQATINSFNGINGILQGRANILDIDLLRMQDDPKKSSENLHLHLKSMTHEMIKQMDEILSPITSSFSLLLNINQSIEIQTKSIEFSLEKFANTSSTNFPSIIPIDINETVLLQKMIQPLPLGDHRDPNDAFTNFSRSLTLSIVDRNQTNFTDPIEFFIPRDPNLRIPDMFQQNVIGLNKFFHYHSIDLIQNNPNLSYSLHLEMQPMNINLSYLLIYQFDEQPQWNSLKNWTYFCRDDLNPNHLWIHFLDNQQTLNHHSIVYGIRQLDLTADNRFCSNKALHPSLFIHDDQPVQFTADYQLRIYQSGCFYLDSHYQWQSDGLIVGPMTNHLQTHCFTTHLTTFTSAYRCLSVSPTIPQQCPMDHIIDLNISHSIASNRMLNPFEIILITND